MWSRRTASATPNTTATVHANHGAVAEGSPARGSCCALRGEDTNILFGYNTLREIRDALLISAALLVAVPAGAADPTYTKDIAPILYEHCATCHRPGQAGPFGLLTYHDARQHLTQIVDATKRRVMPPWKPEPGAGDFVGARVLRADEIDLIARWAKSGAREGRSDDLPPAPKWAEAWELGTPDLVISMPEPYVVSADGGDLFRTFVVPVPTDSLRYVRAIEFHPGNAKVLHHANLSVDRTRSSRPLALAHPA